MAPEYVMHGHLSVKADVFSFGVVMLELISGHRNSSYNPSLDDQNLLEWVSFHSHLFLPSAFCAMCCQIKYSIYSMIFCICLYVV